MRQLGLFEHQDLKEFTKWDSGCEISREGGTLAKKNFGCGGRPDGMAAEEFRMRFFRMEWRRENFGCDMPDRMLAEENFRIRDAQIECWRRRIFGCGDIRVEGRREEFWM